MDVARAPMGYRDVPSGRASVAGEFVRVARLHRARMRGKPFWFLLWRLTKVTRPRGRNKKHQRTRSGALLQAQPQRSLWVIPLRASASAVRDGAASRVRGNDEVK